MSYVRNSHTERKRKYGMVLTKQTRQWRQQNEIFNKDDIALVWWCSLGHVSVCWAVRYSVTTKQLAKQSTK